MSAWTNFRDDVIAMAQEHPKKVAAVFGLGVVLGLVVSWVL